MTSTDSGEERHPRTDGHDEWNPLVPELIVTDLASSLAFYRLLGFRVCFARDNPPFAYLEFGGAQLMLEQEHGSGWNTAPLIRPFGRGVNFQIEVNDCTAIASSLATAGVTLLRAPSDIWYRTGPDEREGQRELLVVDPDGYHLRLAEPLGTRTSPRNGGADLSRD